MHRYPWQASACNMPCGPSMSSTRGPSPSAPTKSLSSASIRCRLIADQCRRAHEEQQVRAKHEWWQAGAQHEQQEHAHLPVFAHRRRSMHSPRMGSTLRHTSISSMRVHSEQPEPALHEHRAHTA